MEQIIGHSIEDGRFDIVLFVYNYVQQEMGNNILKACAEKNVGAILMKTDPFNGRYLEIINTVNKLIESNSPVSEKLKYRYDVTMQKQKEGEEYLEKSGLSDPSLRRKAAIGFVLNNPAVSSVLISFSSFDEIEPYISLSGTRLNKETTENMEILREKLNHLYCRHACGVCESQCPHMVPVNTIMRYHHYFLGQGREKYAMQKYNEIPQIKLEYCTNCDGHCEAACPYEVSIKSLLQAARTDLEMKNNG
jgi:predicted aldo/keto reductase-like oxidoreductase